VAANCEPLIMTEGAGEKPVIYVMVLQGSDNKKFMVPMVFVAVMGFLL
jgi:hypothetical protein